MKNPFKVVVFISGRGSNLKALIENSFNHSLPYRVVGVISDKAEAAGLGIATAHQIPSVTITRKMKSQSKEEFNLKLRDAARSFSPDLIALAGYMRVVGKELIDAFPEKIINIHPSLLPDFKGLDIHKRILESGVTKSGCSVHYVNEEIDDGEILAQAVVPVESGDTEETLAARILKKEHILYSAVVSGIATGAIEKIKLNNKLRTILTDNIYFPKDPCFLKGSSVGQSHYQDRFL